MTPEQYIQRLQEVTNKKNKVLRDIVDLTHVQTRAIAEEELESLEKLISEKQTKIDEITKIDDEFNVYFLRLKHEMKISSLDELGNTKISGIKELQQSVKQVMENIKEISEIEKLNSVNAKALLNKFGNEIKKLNQGKTINSAYKPSPPQTRSYFIDKKK